MNKLKEFFILFFIQLISFGIICINLRAVADGKYMLSATTDFIISAMNFFVIKKISDSGDTLHKWIGYTTGSVAGSFVGIFVSKLIMGH